MRLTRKEKAKLPRLTAYVSTRRTDFTIPWLARYSPEVPSALPAAAAVFDGIADLYVVLSRSICCSALRHPIASPLSSNTSNPAAPPTSPRPSNSTNASTLLTPSPPRQILPPPPLPIQVPTPPAPTTQPIRPPSAVEADPRSTRITSEPPRRRPSQD
jgi:hypothetical protein